MSGQTRLAAFADGAPEPEQKTYNCWNCSLKQDVIIQAGMQKVKCSVRSGLQDFREACSCWSDGQDLKYFLHAPEGHQVKKWSKA